MATEEITISELELADEILGDMNIPVDTATETRAVTLRQLRAWLGSALPVGSIFASVGRIDDERYTLLDGKTISRTGTYEAFCNKVVEKVQAGTWKACTEEEFNQELSETGQCGKFVVSNDYVRIPKYGNSLCSGVIDGTIAVVGNGMTLGLSDGTSLAGLCAGMGGTAVNQSIALSSSIAKYGQNTGEYTEGAASNSLFQKSLGITTDPTKSGIEGKINSVEVFYYMVVSTEGQTASVEIDINQVYEDLNIKANGDLSNVASVAQSFKEQSVGWGMPDYSAKVAVTFTIYKAWVAPCRCLVIGRSYGGGSPATYGFINGTIPAGGTAPMTNGQTHWSFVLDKGDTYTPDTVAGSQEIYYIPFKGGN